MEYGGVVTCTGTVHIPIQLVANSTAGSRNKIDDREPHQTRHNHHHHQQQQQQQQRSVMSSRDNHQASSSVNGRLTSPPPPTTQMATADLVERSFREWNPSLRSCTGETTTTTTTAELQDRRSRLQRARPTGERTTRSAMQSDSARTAVSSGVGDLSRRRGEASRSGGGGGYSSGDDDGCDGSAVVSRSRHSTSARSPGQIITASRNQTGTPQGTQPMTAYFSL